MRNERGSENEQQSMSDQASERMRNERGSENL